MVMSNSVSGRYFRRELVRIIKRGSACGKGIPAKRSSCGGYRGAGTRGFTAPQTEMGTTLTTQAYCQVGNHLDMTPVEEQRKLLLKI